jgi:transcriptional regulator with XRE-family HTH domain
MPNLTTSTAGTFLSEAGDVKAANTTRSSIDIFVGSRLRERRTSRGISEKEFSKALGIDPKDVRVYEKGVKRVGANLLFRISRLLDVRLDYFFQGYPAGEPSTQINRAPTTSVNQSFIS